jgi:predicted aspartyl protease
MTRHVILVLTCLAVSGCASELVLDTESALAVIPRHISDTGHIVVETKLNGLGPFRFAIDTGASISVIYEHARAKVGIEPLPNARVHVFGISGSGQYPLARVAEIRVGDELWKDARVTLLPDTTAIGTRVDGILGVDFLSRYAVLYSQTEKVLLLYPRELVADRAYLGWDSIPLRDLRVGDGNVAVLVLDMQIDAERITTVFDLGATASLMNRRGARALNILVRRPRIAPEIEGVSGGTEVLAELRVRQLRINNSTWRNRIFLVGEFPVFQTLGLDRQPAAIAGADLFGERDFIVDFTRRRLLVKSK